MLRAGMRKLTIKESLWALREHLKNNWSNYDSA